MEVAGTSLRASFRKCRIRSRWTDYRMCCTGHEQPLQVFGEKANRTERGDRGGGDIVNVGSEGALFPNQPLRSRALTYTGVRFASEDISSHFLSYTPLFQSIESNLCMVMRVRFVKDVSHLSQRNFWVCPLSKRIATKPEVPFWGQMARQPTAVGWRWVLGLGQGLFRQCPLSSS